MVSDAPAKMLQLKQFGDQLHTIVSSVVEEVATLQITAEEPLVLDRDWILNKMKDQMAEKEYVLEPRAVQVAQGLGDLLKLPRELRDLIYGHSLRDGDLDMLVLSRQTHQEASEIIFEKGVYRLSLGFGKLFKNPPLSRPLAQKIRNLHIRVDGRSSLMRPFKKQLPILRKFNGSRVERRNCLVTIWAEPANSGMRAQQAVYHLAELTGFERVVLELDFEWFGKWPFDSMEDFVQEMVYNRATDALHFQKETLEPTLGTADVDVDGEGWRLAFHPRRIEPAEASGDD